jgi:hypothetical protein
MGTFSPYEIPGINIGPDGRRYPYGGAPDAFTPRYVCLVYLRFASNGLVVQHAYFAMPPNLGAFAGSEIAAVSSTGYWATAPVRSEINFENFTFGSQQVIVFHIDPTGAPVRFDPANLVQFAMFSALALPRVRNNCFLNAEILSWAGREVLVLENWFVDDAGQPITPPRRFDYAMNVHLLIRSGLAGADDRPRDLPLILDPDTGNMGAGSP